MRSFATLAIIAAFAIAACGQAAAPADADAQTVAGALSDADKAAILQTLQFSADASGQVENACGSHVAPQFSAVDLGGAVGVAQLVIIPGGADSLTCYGDGPGALTLVRRDGAAFQPIYFNQGGFLAVLTSDTDGVRDIAHAGPGFQHPLFKWNGAEYARAGAIADGDMGDATILP